MAVSCWVETGRRRRRVEEACGIGRTTGNLAGCARQRVRCTNLVCEVENSPDPKQCLYGVYVSDGACQHQGTVSVLRRVATGIRGKKQSEEVRVCARGPGPAGAESKQRHLVHPVDVHLLVTHEHLHALGVPGRSSVQQRRALVLREGRAIKLRQRERNAQPAGLGQGGLTRSVRLALAPSARRTFMISAWPMAAA